MGVYLSLWVYVCACVYACVFVCVNFYACTFVCLCLCVCVCVCVGSLALLELQVLWVCKAHADNGERLLLLYQRPITQVSDASLLDCYSLGINFNV
jgi:hypothetical protein